MTYPMGATWLSIASIKQNVYSRQKIYDNEWRGVSRNQPLGAELNNLPFVVDEARFCAVLQTLDTRGALARMFRSRANGRAMPPPQGLTLFPDNEGDFITYLG
ncbi:MULTISPECIES: hypothetical protein [unclassified Burkholderia]|uniref:hypothetical protein n=1 Tax=unclassified Burkholderia TaxID=2613784 RepID=UPI000F57157B|nr:MULTISPECIES: hypothetical protein [unclassified Burkholderia]